MMMDRMVRFSCVVGNNMVTQPTIGYLVDSALGSTIVVSLKLSGLGLILTTILAKILS